MRFQGKYESDEQLAENIKEAAQALNNAIENAANRNITTVISTFEVNEIGRSVKTMVSVSMSKAIG